MNVRIAAIVHEYDALYRRRPFRPPRPRYMMADLFDLLRTRGYSPEIVHGTPRNSPPADLAILHVDVTHVADAYLEFARKYPICANGSVRDISKTTISRSLLRQTDDWRGPVIVKTDLNSRGGPEVRKNKVALTRLRRRPFPAVRDRYEYRILDSLAEVPDEVWSDRALVVERFIPERLADGYAMCHYVFCGDYEFCARYVSKDPVVKAADAFRFELMEVPREMRDRRAELQFDFGKFDFAFHEGKPCLLDANKTVGRIPPTGGASLDGLADGLLSLLASRRG